MSDHNSQNHSLATAASWLTLAKVLAFGVSFLLPLIMVRRLSQADFGLYRQLFLVVSTAMTVLPFGFAMSAFYFLPRAGDHRRAVAMNVVAVYAAIAAIAGGILLFRPTVLATIFNDGGLVSYAPLLAAVLFLVVASSFVDMLALANGDVKGAAAFVVTTYVTKTILLATAAIVFASVRAILIASAVHGLLQFAFLLVYLKRGFGSFLARIDAGLLRRQLAYAIPFGFAYWLYWLQTEAHHYFVARAFGAATYAVYAIGCVMFPLTLVFGESIGFVIIQRVSELHSQNRRDDIVALLGQAVRNLAAFYLPLYAILLVTGRDLLAIVYTPRFLASWPIFAINLTLMPLSILAIISDAVMRSYTECRPFLVGVRMVLVPILLATLWYLTPRYGPLAAISAVVGVNALERFILAGRTAKALRLQRSDVVLLKGVIGVVASVIVAGAAAFIARSAFGQAQHWPALIVASIVFATVYIAATSVRAIYYGEDVLLEWPLAVLPGGLRRVLAELLTRVRPRVTDEAREKAA
jgi:O-antigen/teichoic acid export membrane protein